MRVVPMHPAEPYRRRVKRTHRQSKPSATCDRNRTESDILRHGGGGVCERTQRLMTGASHEPTCGRQAGGGRDGRSMLCRCARVSKRHAPDDNEQTHRDLRLSRIGHADSIHSGGRFTENVRGLSIFCPCWFALRPQDQGECPSVWAALGAMHSSYDALEHG